MNPLDLVRGSPWNSVAFTTYALSLSFFEAVVLDALVRGGGRNALILSDPEGVRAGLSEQGARRAGRDYEIEPVACTTGVFHPKIGAFFADNDAHLLIGSGNLTFGGWGGNLETVEHLHPSFAADAFDDTADFFELLTEDPIVVMDAAAQCHQIAAALRRSTQGQSRSGSIRLAHSVGGSVAADIRRYVDDLGGATRLTIVSPFYDLTGRGIEALAEALGCSDIRLYAHPWGTVRGARSINWPFDCAHPFQAVNVADGYGEDRRLLHAKTFEIQCRRGRLLVSGSANATEPGLFGRNIEASVIRISRNTSVAWVTKPAVAPERLLAEVEDHDDDDDARVGILSAVLEGGVVKARLLTPRLRGDVATSVKTVRAQYSLGIAKLGADGRFQIPAPDLEKESWVDGRLVLRIEQGHKVAEGFISIAAASELIRRAGPLAPRIIAMLAGTETPADVAAILAWFREDPSRIPVDREISGGSSSESADGDERTVLLHQLQATSQSAGQNSPSGNGGGPAWRHAMALLRAAFSRTRGPWTAGGETDDDDDEDQADREKRARSEEQANLRSIQAFDELLPAMLNSDREGSSAILALSLAHFLADRIRPSTGKVRSWLSQILGSLPRTEGPDGAAAVASALIFFAGDGLPNPAVRCRRHLLSKGWLVDEIVVTADAVPAFHKMLCGECDLEAFLEEVRSCQTVGEEVRAYLEAAGGRQPRGSYSSLERTSAWPKLARALDDPALLERFIIFNAAPRSCPRCSIVLPRATVEDLHNHGVGSCCGRILLNRAL